MDRQDDPTIIGEIMLIRRIPPKGDRVQWDDAGRPSPASQNFKDRDDELSTYIAEEATHDLVLAGHDGFGLVQFTAGSVRELFVKEGVPLIICRDLSDPIPGHVLLCAKVTNSLAKKFKLIVSWVPNRLPTRQPS